MISITEFSSFLGIITKRTNNSSRKILNSDHKREMREWASVNGAVVQQTVLQIWSKTPLLAVFEGPYFQKKQS